MCARAAQQQATEQDVRQAGEQHGAVRLFRHGLNSIYYSSPGKGGLAGTVFRPRTKRISPSP